MSTGRDLSHWSPNRTPQQAHPGYARALVEHGITDQHQLDGEDREQFWRTVYRCDREIEGPTDRDDQERE